MRMVELGMGEGEEEEEEARQDGAAAAQAARVGGAVLLALRGQLSQGLDARLAQLRHLDADGSGELATLLWEGFPRATSFFAVALAKLSALPEAVMLEAADELLQWGAYPFAAGVKFPSVTLGKAQAELALAHVTWSRCVADIAVHLIKYGGYQRDAAGLYAFASRHLRGLEAFKAGEPGPAKDLVTRVAAQGMLQWSAVIGHICRRDHAFISRVMCDELPFVAWYFVDISVVAVQVAREILGQLIEKLRQPKLDKLDKLVMVLTLDSVMERVDFRALEARDRKWTALFQQTVHPKIYKTAEQFAKTEDLKAASLGLMMTLLSRSPKAFKEGNFATFFNKRVVRHLTEPRKVTHSLEITLRSLRSSAFSRPLVAWDAFEPYCPHVRFQGDDPSPYAQPSGQARKALEAIFFEAFDKPKSKAFAALPGSMSVGPGLEDADSGALSGALNGQLGSHLQSHHRGGAGGSGSGGGLASGGGGAAGGSGSGIGSAGALTPLPAKVLAEVGSPTLTLATLAVPSAIEPLAVGEPGAAPPSPGIPPAGLPAGHSTLPCRGLFPLPRNLRACKHILLQLAAHDLAVLHERALPSLLALPDDLNKCPAAAANRPIVGLRALWDVLRPGYSAFRATARSANQGQGREKLDGIVRHARKLLPAMLEPLLKSLGSAAYGRAEYPLVPTVLWDSARPGPLAAEDGPRAAVPRDRTGEALGYAFAWADADHLASDSSFALPAEGFAQELQNLGSSQDLFDTGGATAFRARNTKDKIGAEAQIRAAARHHQAFFKKRSPHCMDVLRELLYCFPVLTCSPVGREADPGALDTLLPPPSLLHHADWAIATATSHAYQRIIVGARSDTIRLVLLAKLAAAASASVGPKTRAIAAGLTVLRQLVLLLRLWVHAVKAQALPEPKPDKDRANRLVILAVAVLALPCATMRLLGVEVLECCARLWPSASAAEAVLPIVSTADVAQSRCRLLEECPCGRTSAGASAGDIPRRRRTAEDTRALQNNSNSGNNKSAHLGGGSQLLSEQSKHLSLPHVRSMSSSDMNGSSSSLCGSTASFRNTFCRVTRHSLSRDTLFMWYKSSTAPPAEVGSPRRGTELSGVDSSRLRRSPTAAANAGTASGAGVAFTGLAGDADWRRALVALAHRLVDCISLHPVLFSVSRLMLAWLPRLPEFTQAECTLHQIALRKSISAFVLALSGCNPDMCENSPHSVPPNHVKWPGRLEAEVEALAKSVWDAAEATRTGSRATASLRKSLQSLVGESSHPRCVSCFSVLLLEWREGCLEKAERAAVSPRAAQSESSSKFTMFFRSRSTEPNGGSGSSFSQADTPLRALQKQRVEIERVASCVLCQLLCGGRGNRIPGWETALGNCFRLLAELAKAETLQESDCRLALEFANLVLQSSETVAHELSYIEAMETIILRADSVWPRAERRMIWKLLQRLAGFDDLSVFTVRNQAPVPLAASLGQTMSGSQVMLSDPSGHRSGSSRSVSKVEQTVISEDDFSRLRNVATRAASAMLRLGPTSLGTVAPCPDELLWSWLYNDASARSKSAPGTTASFLCNYLVAHWRVGDPEAAGGGTFPPFLDRWYSQIAASGGPTAGTGALPRAADAIFSAICHAVRTWLFRGVQHRFERALEPTAIAPLALLAIVHAQVHHDAAIRAKAYELLDVIERSSSATRYNAYDFHSGSSLGGLAYCANAASSKHLARRGAILLAECCPHLAPAVVSELCARMDMLVAGGLAQGAVEAVLPWCRSSASKVTALDLTGSDGVAEGGAIGVDDDALLGLRPVDAPSPTSDATADAMDRGSEPTTGRLSSQTDRSRRSSARGSHQWGQAIALPELWRCSLLLWRTEGSAGIDLVLPVFRALTAHHAALVIDFLISKLIPSESGDSQASRIIASVLLHGVALAVFETSPREVLHQLVVTGLYSVHIDDLADKLFAKRLARVRLDRPMALQHWVTLALTAPLHTSLEDHDDNALGNFDALHAVQQSLVCALNLCIASDRAVSIGAMPPMATVSLCHSVLGRGVSASQREKVPPLLRAPEHQCMAILLRALLHERVAGRAGLESQREKRRSVGSQGSEQGIELSNDTILRLTETHPANYSDQQLEQVVAALVELFCTLDSSENLVNLWCQTLLLAALAVDAALVLWNPSGMVRTLKVYKALRPEVPGTLAIQSGHNLLSDASAGQVETLAFARILFQSLCCGLRDVTPLACECLRLLDLREARPAFSQAILSCLTQVEQGPSEAALLKLLLHLPLEEAGEQPFVAQRLVLARLQRAIIMSVTGGPGSGDPSDALRVFVRLAHSPPVVGFYESFVLLVLLVLVDGWAARCKALGSALQLLRLPDSVSKAVPDLLNFAGDEGMLRKLLVAATDALEPAEICGAVLSLTKQHGASERFLAASLQLVAVLLEVRPSEASGPAQHLLSAALTRRADRAPSADLDLAQDKLVRAVAAAAEKGVLVGGCVDQDAHPDPSRSALLHDVSARLASEAARVEEAVSGSSDLVALSPAGSLTSPLSHSCSSVFRVLPEAVGFHSRPGSPAVHSRQPSEDSSHSRAKMSGAVDGGASGIGVSATAGAGNHECFSGGVASFEGSKFGYSDMDRQGLEQDQEEEEESKHGVASILSRPAEPSDAASRRQQQQQQQQLGGPASGGSTRQAKVLEDLLSDPEARDRIETLVEQEGTIERTWLDFAFEGREYKQSPSADKARELSSRFLALDSLDTLELEDGEREALELAVRALPQGATAPADLFDGVLQQSYAYLEEHLLGRYLRSVQHLTM